MYRLITSKYIFWFASLAVLAFIIIRIPHIVGYTADTGWFARWAIAIKQYGIQNVYWKSDTNYLPLFHYILWFYGLFFDTAGQIQNHIYLLRYITLIFDLWGLFLVYKWINKSVSFPALLFISLINLSYIYNNVIWGQVDGILATLAFAALYYVYNRKFLISAVCIVLMLNFKLQGIVFIPLYLLVLLIKIPKGKILKNITITALTAVVVQAIILLPFLFKTGALLQIIKVETSLVGFYPTVSCNAYNFWSFLFGGQSEATPDSTLLWDIISYKQIGLILFFAASLITLFPLLKILFYRWVRARSIPYAEKSASVQLWVTAALIALLFFFFNTQMHERYSYPAFIFITAYSFYRKDFVPYVLFSYAQFMNLEHVLQWLKIHNYNTLIFNRIFIAAIFAITIIYLFVKLYRTYKASDTNFSRLNTQ